MEIKNKAPYDYVSEADYLVMVNLFWQFYKEHQYDYPKGFKAYLTPSRYFNRLIYIDLRDQWVMIPVQVYKQEKIGM